MAITKNTFDLGQPIKVLNPVPDIDVFYGPYSSTTEATNTFGSAMLTPAAVGRRIGVKSTGDTIEEYRWEKTSGGTYDWVPVTSALMETIDEVIDIKIENKAFVYSLIPLYQGNTGATPCHALVI